jgi:nickel-type superoxide dismutase maturation protease
VTSEAAEGVREAVEGRGVVAGTVRRKLLLALLLAAGAVLGRSLGRSVQRVEVTGPSMAPTLRPGDRLLVVGTPWSPQPWPKPGSVIAVRDPRLPARILIKRVSGVDRRAGTLEVAGDAAEASTDSRTFGPVDRSLMVGRAIYRYAPAARSGAAPWRRSTIASDGYPPGRPQPHSDQPLP